MKIIMGSKLLLFTLQLLFVSVITAAVEDELQMNTTQYQTQNHIQNIASKNIQAANSIQQSSNKNSLKANILQSSSTTTTTMPPADITTTTTTTTTQESTTTQEPTTIQATTTTQAPITTQATTTTTTKAAPTTIENCVNNVREARCVQIKRYWQTRYDACKSFRVMRVLCRKFCGLCGTTEVQVQFSPRRTQIKEEKPKRRCREFSKIFCRRFKSHCEEEGRNGQRMRKHCQKTCNSC